MRIINIMVYIIAVSLVLAQSATALQEEIEVEVEIVSEGSGESKVVWVGVDGSEDEPHAISWICNQDDNSTETYTFDWDYEFEYNASEIKWDIGNNITAIHNITMGIDSLLRNEIKRCDDIKDANRELSLKLDNYNNISKAAQRADLLDEKLDECDDERRQCQTDLSECQTELDETKNQWIIHGGVGAAIGAAIVWFTKVKKNLPKGPVDEQFARYP